MFESLIVFISVKQAGKDATYTGIVILGLGVTGMFVCFSKKPYSARHAGRHCEGRWPFGGTAETCSPRSKSPPPSC